MAKSPTRFPYPRIIQSLILTSLLACGADNDITPSPTIAPATPTPTVAIDADNDGAAAAIDCDDNNAAVAPDLPEICDGLDNDCNEIVDDGFDADSDGALDADACGDLGDDCDDSDPFIYIGAEERCDGVDSDCDGAIDEDATDGDIYFADSDDDGFGDAENTITACSQPEGYLTLAQDCDDSTADISPIAAELCDLIDNNCNDEIDEGVENTYYYDGDGDGYGDDDQTIQACSAPDETYVEGGGDCDDTEFASNPGMSEICDGLDNNCDELIDPDNSAGAHQYQDADGDGYGDPDVKGASTCDDVEGYVHNKNDCNDDADTINPDAVEICGDGIDQDCDGLDMPCE